MLDDAVSYIAQDSFDAAGKLLTLALEMAASLKTLGERGRVVPEFAIQNVRELFIKNYRIIYEVQAHEIRVIAFVHCARNIAL
jgi:plasmid stabilization system protein ParE